MEKKILILFMPIVMTITLTIFLLMMQPAQEQEPENYQIAHYEKLIDSTGQILHEFNIEFTPGEILYPDYVHTDTLIVTDNKGLSKAMFYLLSDPTKGSDQDINEVLMQFCAPYTVTGGLQPVNFESWRF